MLDVALGTSDFAIMQRVGNTLPAGTLHCSALGKIALAFGPEHPCADRETRGTSLLCRGTELICGGVRVVSP